MTEDHLGIMAMMHKPYFLLQTFIQIQSKMQVSIFTRPHPSTKCCPILTSWVNPTFWMYSGFPWLRNIRLEKIPTHSQKNHCLTRLAVVTVAGGGGGGRNANGRGSRSNSGWPKKAWRRLIDSTMHVTIVHLQWLRSSGWHFCLCEHLGIYIYIYLNICHRVTLICVTFSHFWILIIVLH